jgi:hypothetical protein
MISMAYARDAKPIVSPCGNDSFLRRNDLNDLRAAVRNRSFLTGRILSLSCSCAWSERVAQRRRFPLALLHRVPDHGRLANGGQKKLRESAAKSLKTVLGVNLCAGRSTPSAGADLPATHTPTAGKEGDSAPSSQAFVVAESGQTTVEFWRSFSKSRVPLRDVWSRLAPAASRPKCGLGSSLPGITH